MEIRIGKLSDVAGITDIFNFYIEHTHARFEEAPFTLENRQKWFTQFSSDGKYQLYVANRKWRTVGFRVFSAVQSNVSL